MPRNPAPRNYWSLICQISEFLRIKSEKKNEPRSAVFLPIHYFQLVFVEIDTSVRVFPQEFSLLLHTYFEKEPLETKPEHLSYLFTFKSTPLFAWYVAEQWQQQWFIYFFYTKEELFDNFLGIHAVVVLVVPNEKIVLLSVRQNESLMIKIGWMEYSKHHFSSSYMLQRHPQSEQLLLTSNLYRWLPS